METRGTQGGGPSHGPARLRRVGALRLWMYQARPTLLSFGHAAEGGGAGAGSDGPIGAGAGPDGAIGAGAGFGARFLAFALLAGFAFFIPFFLRAGAPRFAFLDFFATFNLPNRISQNYATRYHAVAAYLNLCTAV